MMQASLSLIYISIKEFEKIMMHKHLCKILFITLNDQKSYRFKIDDTFLFEQCENIVSTEAYACYG